MINVLHIITDTNIGGAGKHVISLANAINKEIFNIYVACPKNAQIISLLDKDVNVIKVQSMSGDKSLDVKSIYELMKIIKNNKIHVVHTHASLSGRIAAKLSNVKIVYTRHTPGYMIKRGSIKWHINRALNVLLCDKVIGVSNYISSQLKDYGFPEEKILTLYNGIDCSYFSDINNTNLSKSSYGISNELIILTVARLEADKGHKYLLESVSKLIKENYNIKLVLVGSGSLEEELKNLSNALNIGQNVIFTGTIKDIREILSLCHIFVLPSEREALGIALLEAMCMSKPCVGSNVDGIPEVIKDGVSGILVPPKDCESLAIALKKLIDDESLRESMGNEGKNIVSEKFDIKLMIENIESLYLSLID